MSKVKRIDVVKDILVEQWNEAVSSNEELLSAYKDALNGKVDENLPERFLRMLQAWNDYGLSEFITIEKRVLESHSGEYKDVDDYLTGFIERHLL